MPISAHITGGKPNESDRQSSTVGGGGGKVPNSKKPRSRPPISLRDKLGFLSQLPPYSGPYSVGCMDIEVPAANPRTISNIKRNGRHVLQLETVLFTLYYPASFGTGRGKDPSGRKNWSRETWLPRPRFETARGYANFAGIPESASIAYFAATSMLTKLPAYRNSPPARHWPPDGNAKQNGYKVKNKEGPPPEGGSTEPKFPLLFFSHGLGGNRTCYSSMCGEYASYGFVVCAVEHRDGSGPRTFVNHVPEGFGNRDEKENAKGVDHSEEEERKGYHHIVSSQA
jgi:platelet-activating factor acetylhydrolase